MVRKDCVECDKISLLVPAANCCCKTLNVSVPFISRSKQTREIKGREYQLQASILNCMVLIRQNRRGQNNFACSVANFWGNQIKGFYSITLSLGVHWPIQGGKGAIAPKRPFLFYKKRILGQIGRLLWLCKCKKG